MNIKLSKIANPYSIFLISCSLALVLYSLSWAEIFPAISTTLLIFIAVTIFTFSVTAFYLNRMNLPFILVDKKQLKYKSLLIFNTVLWILNFIYSKEIPFLNGARDNDFGIPTIYVFTIGLNSFCNVYCCYIYLLSREKKFLLFSFYCFFFYALVISRGSIIMPLFTMFFVWMNVKKPKVTFKRLLVILLSFLLLIYAFGVASNLRTQQEIASKETTYDPVYNSDVILDIGQASDDFKNSKVPDEFFWTYLYTTSPLSNLQYNIYKNSPSFTSTGVFFIFIDEFLFDTASKPIDAILGRERPKPDLIVDELTVPTTLAGSYNYAGWGGMNIFVIFSWLFPFAYSLCVVRNPMGVIGISRLCTIYFFSIFDNMFVLKGLSFQIMYPIISNFIDRLNQKTTQPKLHPLTKAYDPSA